LKTLEAVELERNWLNKTKNNHFNGRKYRSKGFGLKTLSKPFERLKTLETVELERMGCLKLKTTTSMVENTDRRVLG
jgi:hypothetical protein